MADKYVGLIALELNGVELEVTSFSPTENTGRSRVATMNRQGRATGSAKGLTTYDLEIEVVIPKSGEPNWGAMVDAKVTIYPQDGGDLRETYTGVSLVTKSSRYQVEGEARRTLSCFALNYYTE